METAPDVWRKCSACKKTIALKAKYYVCSVSTCNGQRTGYVFCSVTCFEAHLPGARHRDAGAIERTAPAQAAPPETAQVSGGRRVLATQGVGSVTVSSQANPSQAAIPREILVVVSKIKDYIRAKSDMNTSDGLMPLLSERLREICDEAIENARADGRKTVLDRDLKRNR